MVDLGSFGGAFGNFSAAVAVSPSGQIVGYASTPVTDELHAVSWSKEGMVDLGALPGTEYSYAVGVNAAGDVIGHSDHFNGQTGNVDQRAFLWTKQRGLVDLGSLGGSDTRPTAIRPGGGSFTVDHAVLWERS
jgi:probable HAF family extracellular repeat protein